MPLTPKNRKEQWLQGLIDHETTLTPKNRPEEWMLGLIEGSTTLTPKNRCEEWLKEIIDASGGGSSYTLLGSTELEVSTTSTSVITLDTINTGLSEYPEDALIYIFVKDKAGKRNGYFYSFEGFMDHVNQTQVAGITSKIGPDDAMIPYTTNYGVYPSKLNEDMTVTISARYNATYSGTIDGTYIVSVYQLNRPSQN